MERICLFFVLLTIGTSPVMAQLPCTGGVSVFPYQQTFEASNGNWFSGGTASDWAWGTPAKTVITAAGEGVKCWITGGLNNSSYNNGENAFLQSPCFNFTSLIHPKISFKIFWETEKKFDGALMQYSTDGGSVWNLLGSVNSNSNCLGVNWYNSSDITYLSHNQGWSGNIQPVNGSCQGGSGSGGWLTASHDLSTLAGQTNVIFRFVFGAGTTCNAFDGFAIDDVRIFEAPPNTANFTYTCRPALTVDFTALSACAASAQWNFGDLNSGAANAASGTNPSHTFSGPGTYNVTLNATFPGGPPASSSQQLTVLDVNAGISQQIACAGDQTAVLSAAGAGSNTGYTYLWNTNPMQTTPVITVGAGQYTVTVSSGTACAATAIVNVTEPAPLTIAPVIISQKCLTDNGAVIANISGGTPGYNYLWSNGSSAPAISNLPAGIYSLQVTDSKGCTEAATGIIVPHEERVLTVTLGTRMLICPGEKLLLSPGPFADYLWQDNSTSSTYMVTATGDYSVTVKDVNGCTGTAAIHVTVDCSEIFFPSAFTPNGDGKNELFGPAGNNLAAVKGYVLEVYNRYGELVFRSTDPYKKWNGDFKTNTAGNETFVWFATYLLNGRKNAQKGTVTLIK